MVLVRSRVSCQDWDQARISGPMSEVESRVGVTTRVSSTIRSEWGQDWSRSFVPSRISIGVTLDRFSSIRSKSDRECQIRVGLGSWVALRSRVSCPISWVAS